MLDETKIQKSINQYFTWLKDRTTVKQVNNWVGITVPFLDKHNDYIQIYVKEENNDFMLTDGGYILADSCQTGGDLEKRINSLISGFGVHIEYASLSAFLTINAGADNFAMQLNNLIQAMLAVNLLEDL